MTEEKVKYLIKDIYSGGTPTSSIDAFYDDSGIPWVAIGDMSETSFVYDTNRKITEAGRKNKNLRILPKGTVLYSIYATLGKVSELKIDATINQAILALTEDESKVDKKYFKYALVSLEDKVLKEAAASTISNLNAQKVLNMRIPLISENLAEQKRIASFLDKKTINIDKLISEETESIDNMLKYKKELVNKTVSLGFNKKLVGTNNKWFNAIPEGWELLKIRHVLSLNNGIKVGPFGSALTGKITYEQSDIKVYGQWNVISGDFGIERNFISFDSYKTLKNYKVSPGDILVSMMGTIGKCKTVPKGIEEGVMDSHIIKINLSSKMIPEYFEYFYDKDNSSLAFQQLDYLKKGSIMDGLNSTILKEIYICVPPIKEQKNIVDYLNKKCSAINRLITIKQENIELLKAYKKSIIYECVTGKKEVPYAY